MHQRLQGTVVRIGQHELQGVLARRQGRHYRDLILAEVNMLRIAFDRPRHVLCGKRRVDEQIGVSVADAGGS